MDDEGIESRRDAEAVGATRNKLEIEWLYDSYECDTCGISDALGAIVRLNNAVIIELIPNAHCYSSTTYDESEIYATIFNVFDIDLEFTDTEIRSPLYNMEEDDDDDDEAV